MQKITIVEFTDDYGAMRFYGAYANTTPRAALEWYAKEHGAYEEEEPTITERESGALQLGDEEAIAYEIDLEELPTKK